jgi:hypothetical protein
MPRILIAVTVTMHVWAVCKLRNQPPVMSCGSMQILFLIEYRCFDLGPWASDIMAGWLARREIRFFIDSGGNESTTRIHTSWFHLAWRRQRFMWMFWWMLYASHGSCMHACMHVRTKSDLVSLCDRIVNTWNRIAMVHGARCGVAAHAFIVHNVLLSLRLRIDWELWSPLKNWN